MLLNFVKSLCGLSLLLLVACGSHVQPTAQLSETSLDNFMDAMRWKRFKGAASLMQPELRKDFVKTFTALKDLHITDVKLVDVVPSEENRHLEAILEMEYYLPPSVTVKTFQFDQTWEFFDEDDQPLQGFFIVTPFPAFP